MKLKITSNLFMKFWEMAERITKSKSAMATLSTIFCVSNEDGVILNATDLKTAIKVKAQGVEVIESGNAILPVKIVGELLKKINVYPLFIEVDSNDKGVILAGRSRYKFTTYSVSDFPTLPVPSGAEEFTHVSALELSRILSEGTIAGAPKEEFPKYISGALLQTQNSELRVVSTDGRRLSFSKTVLAGETSSDTQKDVILSLKALDEYQKMLDSFEPDEEVFVLQDSASAYFKTEDVMYSVRCIDSKFPNYEKILADNATASIQIDRREFINALERINIVVGDSGRVVVLNLSPGAPLSLSGRAPEIGEANESVDASISGEPIRTAFNVGFLLSGIKAFRGNEVCLSFNGADGQMMITNPGGNDFIYMLMPIRLNSLETLEED